MRNLKRVLSLALALVMVLGMMVITTSAATADFADADEITYTEAADVISAIGVITGDGGSFYPTRALTREEGAALICYLLMGKDAADKLAGSGNFTDVAATRWSAGEIDYCANLGIIKGYTDANGKQVFNPKGELTAVAYGRMLLGALGYDGDLEGYTGANWATSIASDMISIGLDVDGVAMDAVLTREQAAQMTLQALTCDMVKYDTKGTNITIGDTTVNTGASDAESVLQGANDYSYNSVGDNTMQFVEKYFEDLKMVAGGVDAYGRPNAYKWELDGDVVATVAKKAVKTYTEGFDNKEYNVLIASGYTFPGTVINVNGTIPTDIVNIAGTNPATDLAAREYVGTTIELFNTDSDSKTIEKIVVTQGYLAKVKNIVSTSKVATSNYVQLEVYNPWGSTATITLNDVAATTVTSAYDKIVANYAKGDYVIAYFKGAEVALANYIGVEATTTTVATVTAKKLDIALSGTIVADGVTYTLASGFANASPVLGKEYTLYIDANGYVVGAIATSAVSTDYAYLTDVLGTLTTTIDGSTPAVQGRFVLADGTVEVYDIALTKGTGADSGKYWIKNIGSNSNILDLTSSNTVDSSATTDLAATVFGYTLSDGTITLEALAGSMAANTVFTVNDNGSDTITKNETSVAAAEGTVLLTKDTVYVVYNNRTKTAEVLTGNAALGDTALGTYVGVAKGNTAGTLATASVIFDTVGGGVVASASDYAYIDESEVTLTGTAAKTVYVYEGILPDGTTIELTSDTALTVSAAGSLYEYTDDNEVGNKITYTAANTFTGTETITWGRMFVNGDMMNFNGGSTYYDISNANVVYVDNTLTEVNDNAGFVVCKKVAGVTTIETIYVVVD